MDEATDVAVADSITDLMQGKTVAKITVTDASDTSGDIYGSINIHFTDDTVLLIKEGGQAGYIEYLICLPPVFIDGECPNNQRDNKTIDTEINAILDAAGIDRSY